MMLHPPRVSQRQHVVLYGKGIPMNPNDDKLKQLLGQWRDIEPRAQFEADVLRRIRQAEPEPRTPGWFSAPLIWANAVALLMGVVVGAYAGLSPISNRQDVAVLKPGTLTGNYVSMITGGEQ
jgi:hypothetical protein